MQSPAMLSCLLFCILSTSVMLLVAADAAQSPAKVPEIPNAVHYPIYIPVSGAPQLYNSQGFAPQGYGPLMADNQAWMGMASEGYSEWANPLIEIYDEQQLQRQKERLRQKMNQIKSRQDSFRQESQRRVQRPRDGEMFDNGDGADTQASASNLRRRKTSAFRPTSKWQLEQQDSAPRYTNPGTW